MADARDGPRAKPSRRSPPAGLSSAELRRLSGLGPGSQPGEGHSLLVPDGIDPDGAPGDQPAPVRRHRRPPTGPQAQHQPGPRRPPLSSRPRPGNAGREAQHQAQQTLILAAGHGVGLHRASRPLHKERRQSRAAAPRRAQALERSARSRDARRSCKKRGCQRARATVAARWPLARSGRGVADPAYVGGVWAARGWKWQPLGRARAATAARP